jgi:Tol biopolymer transport system component
MADEVKYMTCGGVENRESASSIQPFPTHESRRRGGGSAGVAPEKAEPKRTETTSVESSPEPQARRRTVTRVPRRALIGAVIVTLSGMAAGTALASFPGRNGKIIFASTRTGSNQLWTMDSKGKKPKRVTRSALEDGGPSVSRDGRWIAFERLGRRREIYIVRADGRKLRRLTRNDVDDAAPSWAPDGQRIVFRSDRDGDPEIYVMRRNGKGLTQLTFNELVADDDPEFSPDGKKIAFVSRRTGNAEIFVMNADGTAQTQITNDPAIDALPTWSPDGRRIAFESRRAGNPDVWIMNADGSAAKQLTKGGAHERFPAFSPNGRSIVYERRSTSTARPAIWTMDTNGGHRRRLTNLRSSNGTPDWQARRR